MRKLKSIIQSIKWSEISTATYVRYILMIVAILNMVLTRLGINPINISEDALYQTVSDIASVIILITNTWCNNSVTQSAIDADKYMKGQWNDEN